MKKFDFYEFAAVLCPGALLVLALVRLEPELGFLSKKESYSFGDLGILILLSYVTGQLVQALGTVIATVWWQFWSGLPSDWVRSGKHTLIAEQQREQLPEKIVESTGITLPGGLEAVAQKDWQSILSQIYAVVRHSGRAGRVDIFNGYYGMFRGLNASLLLVTFISIIERGWIHRRLYVLFIVGAILALLQMHRFAISYARELFVQFLTTVKNDKPPATSKETE